MASTGKCPYCGNVVRSDEKNCPHCGAVNEQYVVDTPRTVFLPRTIEELQEYCAERGMPLLRMRFFIGENYREPKAFGIYRDGDEVVVYKNKANGQRAIRYRGKDEAYGVNELFQKLLEECHNRGIYPDGEPMTRDTGGRSGASSSGRQRSRGGAESKLFLVPFFAIVITILLMITVPRVKTLSHQSKLGYYDFGDGGLYYKVAAQWSSTDVCWYYTQEDDPAGTWYMCGTSLTLRDGSSPEKPGAFFLGPEYREDWGFSPYDWERNNSNLSGYYSSDDGGLYYLRSTFGGDLSLDYYTVYRTGEDRPDGSWYDLGTIWVSGSSPLFKREDGTYLHFVKKTSGWDGDANYLGREYREEWGFSPVRIPVYTPGYYNFGDGRLLYCSNRSWASGEPIWYYSSPDSHSSRDSWHRISDDSALSLSDGSPISTDEYSAGYLGTDWDSDWGGSDFAQSSFSRSGDSHSSSDWDSWDSDDTDWDSDW